MASTVQQKEQKLQRDDFKDSINHWIAEVPDLSTPHYEKEDDLMPPQAYDEIRELVGGLQYFHHSSTPCVFLEWKFYENWQIDRGIPAMLTMTEEHITKDLVGIAPGYAEAVSCCKDIRNVIETNLPFTVFCRLVNSGPGHTTHGIYRAAVYERGNGTHKPGTDPYIVPPEQNKLLAIIINQQSKIDRLESMLLDMDSRLQSIDGRQREQALRNKEECARTQKMEAQQERDLAAVREMVATGGRYGETAKPQVEVEDLIDLSKNPFDDF